MARWRDRIFCRLGFHKMEVVHCEPYVDTWTYDEDTPCTLVVRACYYCGKIKRQDVDGVTLTLESFK